MTDESFLNECDRFGSSLAIGDACISTSGRANGAVFISTVRFMACPRLIFETFRLPPCENATSTRTSVTVTK